MSSSSGTEMRKRTQIVGVRCTPDEAVSLGAAARRQGKTISAAVRDALIGPGQPAPRRPRRKAATADVQELCRLLAEAGKIGSNVNQLARVANTNGDVPGAVALEAIWHEIHGMKSALMVALGHGD